MASKLLVADSKLGGLLGAALIVAGVILLDDAYGKRGKKPPFIMKFLPGA